VQRAEFLDFAQADSENVVEGCFIDAGEQHPQPLGAERVAIGIEHDNLARLLAEFTRQRMPADDKLPQAIADHQFAARASAIGRRQIAVPPLRRKPVQHGPAELHQGRFAGFIGAVK
jgi:hypothetical protein